MIGVTLLILAIFNGFAGYSLLDDQLSGTGPAHRVLDRAVDPGGRARGSRRCCSAASSPAPDIIDRLFVIHVLISRRSSPCCSASTSAILVRHKHTQFPGRAARRTTSSASGCGRRYAAKALGLFFLTAVGALPASAAWRRSTRSGCSARSTRPRCQRRLAARLVHGLARRRAAHHARRGRSAPSASRSRTRSSRACCSPASRSRCCTLWPFLEARVTGDYAEHHIARPPPRTAGAHRARRGHAVVLLRCCSSARRPT